jgi:hypothetical protein
MKIWVFMANDDLNHKLDNDNPIGEYDSITLLEELITDNTKMNYIRLATKAALCGDSTDDRELGKQELIKIGRGARNDENDLLNGRKITSGYSRIEDNRLRLYLLAENLDKKVERIFEQILIEDITDKPKEVYSFNFK